jgi:hypothetical protein
MKTALFWFVTQRVVIISYRHFDIGPIFRGLVSIYRPETLVRNYHYSLYNNPEERSPHVFRGRSLKSRKLLDDFKTTREYWKLKEDALDCTLRRTHFG